MRSTVWIGGTGDQHHALEHLAAHGERAAIVTGAIAVGGETIRLAVSIDRSVVAKRMYSGGDEPLLDLEALEALWELPGGIPTPVEDLPLWLSDVLAPLPGWALDQREAEVTRTFEPCVSLLSVVSAPMSTVEEAVESSVWFMPWVRCIWAAGDEHEALDGAHLAAAHGLEVVIEGNQLRLAGAPGVPTPLRWHLEELAWRELRP